MQLVLCDESSGRAWSKELRGNSIFVIKTIPGILVSVFSVFEFWEENNELSNKLEVLDSYLIIKKIQSTDVANKTKN